VALGASVAATNGAGDTERVNDFETAGFGI
jgi:hypothetical protein